ncbi:MAG: YdcF family protein [Ilumatobacteraceae bacterium]
MTEAQAFGVRRRLLGPHPLRRITVWAVAALVVYFLANLAQVWWVGRSDGVRRSDAIVVMGAAQYDGRASPQLAARLDHALALYEDAYAPIIVVTGGKQPGDRFTEAESSTAYLVDRGVPVEAIRQENEGRTSFESLQGAAELLDAEGLNSVILVSDPFHSLRIRLTAEGLGLDAVTSPTRTSPVTGAAAAAREVKEAAGVSLGRIIGFSRLPT